MYVLLFHTLKTSGTTILRENKRPTQPIYIHLYRSYHFKVLRPMQACSRCMYQVTKQDAV